jgi:hypothetical protein
MRRILAAYPQYYKATARTVRAKREHHGPVRLLSCVLEVDMRHALALIVNIIHIIYKYQILICIIKYQISNIKYQIYTIKYLQSIIYISAMMSFPMPFHFTCHVRGGCYYRPNIFHMSYVSAI